MAVPRAFQQYLTNDGTPTGLVNANVDASSGLQRWFVQPTTNERFELLQLVVVVKNSLGLADKYGMLMPLANGITVHAWDSGFVSNTEFAAQRPIKNNGDWGSLSFEEQTTEKVQRWRFRTATGAVVVLSGRKSQSFGVELNDDFSGMEEHLFLVQGRLVNIS